MNEGGWQLHAPSRRPAEMNYYEHHLGDYAEATAHLSFVEDAAYGRLIRKCYATELPLPEDKRAVQRLVGARTKEERQAVDDMLDEFFRLQGDGWHNPRCDLELARYQDKQRKAKASADARWAHGERNANASQKDANASAPPDANAMRTQCEGNAPRERARPRPRARSSPQSPVTSLASEMQTAGVPQKAAALLTPPPFDGANAGELNGKAIAKLSPAFELPDTWGLDAQSLGFQPREVLNEAEKFRQYWTSGNGAGKRKGVKGWRQSWSNWLGKAAEKRR
jgi:uncharacterized protein YdaU (DUF1376 family)